MKSGNSNAEPAIPTRGSIAERIAIEASHLARMAKAAEFPLLAYLIDMAVLEAWREASESASDPAPDNSQPAHGS